MRVAFDATLDDEPITGISLSARRLADALAASGLEVLRWGARHSGQAPRHGKSRTGWVLSELPRLLEGRRPELFHAFSNFNLPLNRIDGVRFVLTVHDAVPLILPETVSTLFRWQFRVWLSRSLKVAHRIIFVSEAARRDVAARFEIDLAKTEVVHHGVDHVRAIEDPVTEQWLDALALPERFVLYAGALDARKNVELVLDACERLFDGGRRVTLVLAGQRWFGSGRIEREVERLKARGLDIRPLGYLHDVPFYALMRRAGVFVFPSRYEGFGLPPLEAMSLGVPTIVSNAGSLPEIAGDGALQVRVDDSMGLAEHLDRLLRSEPERRSLSERGLARARAFRWASASAAVKRVYEAALANS